MTRRTFNKRILRRFDLGKSKEGGPALIERDTLREAAKPTERIVKCGVFDVKVMVSEGQAINEYKICKRFMKEQQKKHRR